MEENINISRRKMLKNVGSAAAIGAAAVATSSVASAGNSSDKKNYQANLH